MPATRCWMSSAEITTTTVTSSRHRRWRVAIIPSIFLKKHHVPECGDSTKFSDGEWDMGARGPSRGEGPSLLLLVNGDQVEFPRRFLVEERAFLLVAAAHVDVTGRDRDVGARTDPPLLPVLGLVDVGTAEHDDPELVGVGVQWVGETGVELGEGAI